MKHEALDIDIIGKRLEHGLPITINQCRWLFTQRTGRHFKKKRPRCKPCDGEGTIRVGVGAIQKHPPCSECDGKGYSK